MADRRVGTRIVATSPQIWSDISFLGSGGACEGEQALDVAGRYHERPLAADVIEATQQELAEAGRGLDDAERRFGNLLAESLEFPAFGGLEAMRRRLGRCRVVRR